MAFPEWTKKHKEKGIYIGKNRDGYFLYRAKSVYDPITKKGKKTFVEYLGIITEEDGFIKKKDKFDGIIALEFGASSLIYRYCKHTLERHIFNDSLPKDLMICCAIIYYIYGFISPTIYYNSYISQRFPNLDFSLLTETRTKKIVSLSKHIDSGLTLKIADKKDLELLVGLLKTYPILRNSDGSYALPPMPVELKKLIDKYNLEVEK